MDKSHFADINKIKLLNRRFFYLLLPFLAVFYTSSFPGLRHIGVLLIGFASLILSFYPPPQRVKSFYNHSYQLFSHP